MGYAIGIKSDHLYASAFVGLAVMILLFPAPALVSKVLNGVQKQKMQAVSISSAYNVLSYIELPDSI